MGGIAAHTLANVERRADRTSLLANAAIPLGYAAYFIGIILSSEPAANVIGGDFEYRGAFHILTEFVTGTR